MFQMFVNFNNLIFTLIVYCLFYSCNSGSNQSKNAIPPYPDLTGELFIVAPELDSIRCLALGDCDCCLSHYLFISDTEFIAVDYCIDSDTYYGGSYIYKNNQILFTTNGNYVDKEYLVYNIRIKPNQGNAVQFKWSKYECNKTSSFVTDDSNQQFATPDLEKKFVDLVKTIKQEGIWDSLGMR